MLQRYFVLTSNPEQCLVTQEVLMKCVDKCQWQILKYFMTLGCNNDPSQ